MKILLISNMYPSNKYPSYGVFVKNTEDILVNNSYRVERVALRKQDNKILKVMDYIFFYMKIVLLYIL